MAIASTVVPTGADELVVRINAWIAAAPAYRASGEGIVPPGALDLEAELHSVDWWSMTPEAEVQLDRLRKKIEVARRLCRYYLPDLSRAAAPIPLSAFGVQRLCALLLRTALLQHDARYLNSALKLLDGVLGRNDLVFPAELRALAHSTLDVLVPLTA